MRFSSDQSTSAKSSISHHRVRRRCRRTASRFELLERRDLLAADIGSSDDVLPPAEQLSIVYGAIGSLDSIGRKLQSGLDVLDDAGLVGTAANTAIQLLGIDEIPLVKDGLGQISNIGSFLRELALKAGTTPAAQFNDGPPPDGNPRDFGETTSEQTVFAFLDGRLSELRIPTHTPSGDLPMARAQDWAATLQAELTSASLDDYLAWQVIPFEGSPVLVLSVVPDSDVNELTVTTAAVDLPTGLPNGRLADDVSFQFNFTIETLDGSDRDGLASFDFPAAGGNYLVELLAAAPADGSDIGAAPIASDNVDLNDLADDYNAALRNVPVAYPDGFFDGERPPDSGGSERTLATYFTVIADDNGTTVVTDDRLQLISRHADVVSFQVLSVLTEPAFIDASVSETTSEGYSQLGLQGVRGVSGVDRLIAQQLRDADDPAERVSALEAGITELMDRLGLPTTAWNYDASTEVLTFTVDESLFTEDPELIFERSVDLDFNRNIALGPLGDLELVATAQAEASIDLDFSIQIGVSLGSLPVVTSVGGETPLASLDGGRGIRRAVGIAAANPPVGFVLTEDLSIPIEIIESDGSTTVLSMALSADATTDNRTIGDLIGDFAAAAIDADPEQRIEFAAVDGVIHLRALDRSIRRLSFAALPVELQRGSGFRSRQTSSDPVTSLGGRVAYPDLIIYEVDATGMTVTTYPIDLDRAASLDDVAEAIELQTDGRTTASFEEGCFVLTNATAAFRVDAANPYGVRSMAALLLGLLKKSQPDEGAGHRLVGESLRKVPLAERLFVGVPAAGEDTLNLDLSLSANDLRVGAALGFIEFDVVSDPENPLLVNASFPIRLQSLPDAVDPTRITLADFLRADVGDFFAPVTVGSPTFGGSLLLKSTLLNGTSAIDGVSDFDGTLATLSLSGSLSDIQFNVDTGDFGDLLSQLRELSVADMLSIARDFLATLADGESIAAGVLNADIPLVNRSLNDIIGFVENLLGSIERVASSVDREQISTAIEAVETAISNLPIEPQKKTSAREALQAVRGVINGPLAENLVRLPGRLIAAVGQLEDLIADTINESVDATAAGAATAFDVNGDGETTPRDALMVINFLGRMRGSGVDPEGAVTASAGGRSMDVNRDGRVTSRDALAVINELGRTSRSAAPEAEIPGLPDVLSPLQQELVDAITALRGLIPDLGGLSDRIAAAIRDRLPSGPATTVRFDIIPDFDGDASADRHVAIVAGLETSYSFGPLEFDPMLDLGSLGPVAVDLDASLSLEGSIDLGLGFGVKFDPTNPAERFEAFLIAADASVINDNIVATHIGIGARFDAPIDASVSIAGVNLISANGSVSLGDGAGGGATLTARLVADDGVPLGPLGSLDVSRFGIDNVALDATGGITGNINLSLLGRTVVDAVTLNVPLDNLTGATFDVDVDRLTSLFTELDFDLLTIIAGIEEFLGVLEIQLIDNLSDVPLIGGGLRDVGRFIEDLRVNIVDPIRDIIEAGGGNLEGVRENIDNALTTALSSIGVLSNDDLPSGEDPVTEEDRVTVVLDREKLEIVVDLDTRIVLADVDFDSNFGGLPLQSRGGVMVSMGLGVDIGLGVSRNTGFYLLTTDQNELRADVSATLDPASSLELDLFILNVSATDDVDDIDDGEQSGDVGSMRQQSGAAANVFLDLGDAGRRSLADLDVTVGGGGGATLDLVLEARTGLDLASVATELQAGWNFTFDTGDAGFDSQAYFSLNDITLDLGEFLGKTIAPTIRKLDEVIGPVSDVVDILTTPIPGVSDLAELAGADPITLLDLALAEMSPEVGTAARKFVSVITGIDDVIGKINDLLGPEGSDESLMLNFGSISFGSEVENPGWNNNDPFAAGSTAIAEQNLDSNPLSRLGRQAESLVSSLSAEPGGGEDDDDGLGIDFPIFDPQNIIKLLLGQTVDLVTWDIPTLALEFGWSQSFPIFPVPPISVAVGLDVGFTIDLLVGLDTRGLKTGGLLDGFFLGDLDPDTDVDIDEFVFSLGVSLAALLDVGVASAGIEGEIRGEVAANFRDPDRNGKLYFDEIADIIRDEGLVCVFDLEARIRAILRVVFKVLFFEGSVDIIDVVVFEASNEGSCPPVNPAHVSDGMASTDGFSNRLPEHLQSLFTGPVFAGQEVAPEGTLIVHSGDFASQRGRRSSDTGEEFSVVWLATDVVRVVGMGLEREYAGVKRVLFDGGLGVDRLNLFLGDTENVGSDVNFPIPVTAHGGVGNDVLVGGNRADRLIGGLGDDQLTGNGGNDSISGEGGDDTIDGGNGNDGLFGGPGRDTIRGGDDADLILGGSGRDVIFGDNGDDQIDGNAGNDVIEGGEGDDILFGSDGHDYIDGGVGDDSKIVGGAGNDLLIGGDGQDGVFGGFGNDVIFAHFMQVGVVGGPESDYLEGGPDDDFICGSAGANEIHGGSTDFGIAETGISFDEEILVTAGGYAAASCIAAPTSPLPEEEPVTLLGNAFRDLAGDTMRDDGDALFDGVTIRVLDVDGLLAAEVETGPIDRNADGRIEIDREAGQWSVDGLDPGSYRVEVVLPPGFYQSNRTTAAGDLAYFVTLESGQSADDLTFGLTESPVIRGIKFLDIDGDGVRDDDEPGLAGVIIVADPDDPAPTDDGNIRVITRVDNPDTPEDETGTYELTGLKPGGVTVFEQTLVSGLVEYTWRGSDTPDTVPTSPIGDSYRFELTIGESVSEVDFGNRPASDLHVVVVASPSTTEVQPTPPTGISSVAEGDVFFVELWVSGTGVGELVGAVSTTLRYDTAFTTSASASTAVYGSAFTNDQIMPMVVDEDPDNPSTGIITNLSASLGNTTTSDEYRLFARLPFGQSSAEYVQQDQLRPVLKFGPDSDTSQIILSRVGATVPQLFRPDDTRLIVDRLDLDDDRISTVSDADLILDAVGSSVDDAGPLGRRLDFDDSGLIDLGDLAIFFGMLGGDSSGGSFASASFGSAVEMNTKTTIPIALATAAVTFFQEVALPVAALISTPFVPGTIVDGNDTIYGYDGSDTIFGDNSVTIPNGFETGGNDLIVGGAGRDEIDGQLQNDVLWGGSDTDPTKLPSDINENDQVFGGDGFDEIRQLAAADQTITASKLSGQGDDFFAGIETATLYADDAAGRSLTVAGFTGPVTLVGGEKNDTLIGGPNADRLIGGGGDDLLQGNAGDDTYVFARFELPDGTTTDFATDEIFEASGGGVDTLDFSSIGREMSVIDLRLSTIFDATDGRVVSSDSAELENVIGTPGSDTISGNAAANRIDGGPGKDIIEGGAGADTLIGGGGDDLVVVSAGGDVLAYADAAEAEADSVTPTGPAFTLDFSAITASSGVTVNLRDESFATTDSREVKLTTTLLSTTFIGLTVIGSGASDRFYDTGGSQTYRGGEGNDVYRFFGASGSLDSIFEADGGGVDTIDLSNFTTARTVDLSDPAATVFVRATVGGGSRVGGGGAAFFENIIGGNGDDILRGNATDNVIDGRGGNDTLIGLNGSDTYRFGPTVGNEIDQISESIGNDSDTIDFTDLGAVTSVDDFAVTVNLNDGVATHSDRTIEFSGNSIENIIGSIGNDQLTGGLFANVIDGGKGDDVIDGGFGDDTLIGGTGSDQFSFSPLRTIFVFGSPITFSESDTVVDKGASAGEFGDTLDFSNLSATGALDLNIDLSASDILATHRAGLTGTALRTITLESLETTIEHAMGSEGDDIIVGNDFDNRLFGGPGNDTIDAGFGDDLLDGGSGENTLSGGRGADVLRGVEGTNILIGGPGNDVYSMTRLSGSVNAINVLVEEDASVTAGTGALVFGGRDTIVLPDFVTGFNLMNFDPATTLVPPELFPGYSSGGQSLTIDLMVAGGRDGSHFENIISLNSSAALVGNGGDNLLVGGLTLTGLGGNDVLLGNSLLGTLVGDGGPVGSDGDDLIVGGTVDVGASATAADPDYRQRVRRLVELQREWTRNIPLADRIATLTAGIGDPALRQRLVPGDTVIDDGLADSITTGGGFNWVLPPDVAAASAAPEAIGSVTDAQIDAATGEDTGVAITIADTDAVVTRAALASRPSIEAATAASHPAAETILRVRVVPVVAPSPGSATLPPPASERVTQGDEFFAEVWVQSTDVTAPGLTGIFLDLVFDPDLISVAPVDVIIGDQFELLPGGVVRSERGLVDDLGGVTMQTDVAAGGNWVRLAVVVMTADAGGTATLLLLPGKVQPAQFGIGNVGWDQVELEEVSITITPQLPYQNPSDPFDVDGSGAVDPFDVLALLNYLNNTTDTTPPPITGDFPPPFYDVDGNNRIDPFDVLSLLNFLNSESSSATYATAADEVFAKIV